MPTRPRVTAMSRLAATALVAPCRLTLRPACRAAQWKWRDGGRHQSTATVRRRRVFRNRAILERPPGMERGAVPRRRRAVAGRRRSRAGRSGSRRRRPAEPALEAKLRKEAEAKAAQQKAEEAKIAAARADNCLRARSQLKMLDDGVRIARPTTRASAKSSTTRAAATRTTRTRAIIASDCR